MLMTKNVNIMGVHWKIPIFFFWEGGGWIALKSGAWIVCRLNRGLGKKEKRKGLCFWGGREGGWDPNAHYELEEPSYWHKYPKQITL